MKQLLIGLAFLLMLVSCGLSSNEMTTERAQKSLLGFTLTDPDFLEYDKGRSMGQVTGIIETSENKIEILFTVLNAPCDYMCDQNKWRQASNGKALAFSTTEGKWILDCIQYENYYGSLMLGRQSCNLNRDMDEMETYQLDTQTEKSEIDSNRSTSGPTELQHSTESKENQSTESSGNYLPDIYSGDTSQLSVREDEAVSISAFKSTYFAHLSRTESDDGVRIWGEQTDLPNPELIKQILEVDTAAVRLNTDNKISYIRCDETNSCEWYRQIEATRFALGMGFIVYMGVDGVLRGIGDVVVQDDGTIRRLLPYPGNLEQVIDFQIADQTTMTRKSDGSVAFWTGGQKSVYDSFPVEQLKLVRDVQFTPKIINTINQDGGLVEFRYANSSWVSRIITIPEKVTKFIDGDCATKGGRLLLVTENGATRQYFNDGLSTAGNVDVRQPMYCHYDPMDETYYLIGFNDGKEIVQQPLQ